MVPHMQRLWGRREHDKFLDAYKIQRRPVWLERRKQRPGRPKKPTRDVSLCPEGFGPRKVSDAERVSITSAFERIIMATWRSRYGSGLLQAPR